MPDDRAKLGKKKKTRERTDNKNIGDPLLKLQKINIKKCKTL